MTVSNTPAAIIHKIIVMATGVPGSESLRDDVLALYESRGDWQEVARALDTYLNTLLAGQVNGIPGMLRQLAKNGVGVDLSLQDAQALTQDFAAKGITTWSGLFEWLHVNLDGDLAATWNNRADGAARFTDLLGSLDKNDDYNGAQVLNAAREWVSGIGASDASVQAANEAASKLISRFIDGKVKGTAIDGYVAGATVFIDVNNNGKFDEGEPVTVTDASGNFIFDQDILPTGTLIGTGGTDLATGQPFSGVMTAPSGAAVISPLTTLVQQMMSAMPGRSQADVEDILFKTLDMPRVDLSSFDPIESALASGASRSDQVTATNVQAITSQLVNLLNVSDAVINKTGAVGGQQTSSTLDALINTIVQAAAEDRIVRLGDRQTISDVVNDAAIRAGAVNPDLPADERDQQLARVQNLANKAAVAVSGINERTQQSAAAFAAGETSNIVDAFSDLFKLQTLTQTTVAPAIEDSSDGDLDTVVNRFTGDSLTNEVADIRAGQLDANTSASPGNVTLPKSTTAVPTVRLANDTGASAEDRITRDAELVLGNLVKPETWQYSLDGGSTWTNGSGDSLTPTGQGDITVLVRQSDPNVGDTAQVSFKFNLDTAAPSVPLLTLVDDTGSSASDRVTSKAAVQVAGLESGASWEYSVDGSTWAAGSGSSVDVTAPEGANREHTVYVRQADVAGNISAEASLTFKLDTHAMSPGLALTDNSGSGSDMITNNGSVTLSGLESGATWEYSTDGSTWAAGSGSSVDVTSPEGGDRDYTVYVRQTDVAGNTSVNTSLTFTLDKTAPAAAFIALAVNSGSASDLITNSGAVTVSGLESGATWQYSVDGSTWTTGSGSSFDATSGKGNGDVYTVQVRQTDVAGNTSAAASLTFTLDTEAAAPSLTLSKNSGSASDSITNDGTVSVGGLESGASWEYRVVGSSVWETGSGSSFDATSGEGNGDAYTVEVRQTDVAGNTSAAASLSFTLDTEAAAPSLALFNNSGSTSDTLTNDGRVSVTGLESGASWQYSVDGSNWTTGSGSTFDATSGEGNGDAYTVQVRQTDVAGNTSAAASLTFTLDTEVAVPSLALIRDTGSASDFITYDGRVLVRGLESGASWEYSVDGSNWTLGSGSGVNVTAPEGVNKDYTVQVRQTDVAGNTSAAASLTFSFDNTAPAATSLTLSKNSGSASDSITNDGTVSVGGLESGATWEYSVDGSNWTTGSGSTFDATSGEGNGDVYTVQVRQTDVAGNTSAAASLTFTLDNTAPDKPTLYLIGDSGRDGSDGITSTAMINVGGRETDGSYQYQVLAGEQTVADASEWSSSFDNNSISFSSFNAAEGRSDGVYTVFVRQSDIAGNVSDPVSLQFTLDTAAAAPSLALVNNSGSTSDTLTNDGRVSVTGLESGASWEYSTNGSTWTTGSGSSFDATSGEGNGDSYTVQVRQTDIAGNTSAAASLTFTLDTEAAAPSLTLSKNSGSVSDMITNQGSVTVGGLESGATWEYSVDGSIWTAGSGSSVDVTSPEGGDRDYTVYVRQSDVAGNTSAAASLTFTLDTFAAAPSLTLSKNSGSASDSITNDGTVSVGGMESGATWEYSVDGSNWTLGSGGSVDVTSPEGGDRDYTVYVRQSDVAGNTSAAASLTFTLDTKAAAPSLALSVNSGSSSDMITNSGALTVSALESGASWQYQIHTGSTASVTESLWTTGTGSSLDVPDADDIYTVFVRQTDVAGNTSTAGSLSFTLDTTAPEGLGVSLVKDTGSNTSDRVTNDGRVQVDLSGLEEGGRWVYSLDGGSTLITGESSLITFTDSANYHVVVVQYDQADNPSTVRSLSFTLDKTAPSALTSVVLANDTGSSSTDLLTNDGTISIGDIESGASWEWSIDNGSSWTPGSGSTVDVTAAEGDDYVVLVRQIDLAGNESGATSLSFRLDNQAPTSLSVNAATPKYYNSQIYTNDKTMSVTLTSLESGASWEYQFGSSSGWSVNESGWIKGEGSGSVGSFELDGSDGSYTVAVRQVDAAGNVSSASTRTIILDTTVTATPLINGLEVSGQYWTQSATITLSDLEPGATWQRHIFKGYDSFEPTASEWQNVSGSSFDLTDGDGLYTVFVRQIDVAGNISPTKTLYPDLDNVPPSSLGISLKTDSGRSTSDRITNDGTVVVSGLGGSYTWEWSEDGGSTWSSAGSGSTFDFTSEEGVYDVLVRQIDRAGNKSTSTSYSFTLDKTAPAALTSVVLANDTGSNNSDKITTNGTVNVGALESGASWKYSLNGSDWTTGSGSSFTVTNAEGATTERTIYVRQTDVAGNESNSASLTFTLDNTVPSAPSLTLSSDYLSVAIAGIESGAKWQYSVNSGSTWQDGSGSTFSAVDAEGASQVHIRQVDLAGNAGISDMKILPSIIPVPSNSISDYYSGTPGDDIFDATSHSLTSGNVYFNIDGNGGRDTLKLNFTETTVDFMYIVWEQRFKNIEVIDLSYSSSAIDKLWVFPGEIALMTDSNNTLEFVFGSNAKPDDVKADLLNNFSFNESSAGLIGDLVTVIGVFSGQTVWTLYGGSNDLPV